MGIKEVSVLYVICPQSHLLRSVLHPTESLAIGPHVSPLCLSSGPGPGRPPCQLHDEALDCTWLRQILGRTYFLVVVGLKPSASSWLLPGGCTQYLMVTRNFFPQDLPQHTSSHVFQQAESRTSVLSRQSLIKGNLLTGGTSHHLCLILLVRSRSQVLPTLGGEDYPRDLTPRGGGHEGPPESAIVYKPKLL